MAIVKQISFFINGFNVADAITEFSFEGEGEEIDSTTVASVGAFRSYERGFKEGTLETTGIFDSDTVNEDEIHDILSNAWLAGTTNIVTASRGTIAVGSEAIMMDGPQLTYEIPHTVGELIMSNATFRADDHLEFGVFLMNAAQAAGTNNGTSHNNTVDTTNGGFMQVHLDNNTASDVDVKVQHSDDNSVWADLAGAAVLNLSAGNAAGSAAVAAGTTVQQYTRAVATVTGGTTTLVTVAFARG
jgi:hypothetical protein